MFRFLLSFQIISTQNTEFELLNLNCNVAFGVPQEVEIFETILFENEFKILRKPVIAENFTKGYKIMLK